MLLKIRKGPEMYKLLSNSVETLDLCIRTQNVLRDAGINSISQLIRYSPIKLLKVKNMGRRSLNEIKDELARNKLSLMNDSSPSFIETAPILTITLRDYFANTAMQAILTNNDLRDDIIVLDSEFYNEYILQYIAPKAYEMADAMLKERDKK